MLLKSIVDSFSAKVPLNPAVGITIPTNILWIRHLVWLSKINDGYVIRATIVITVVGLALEGKSNAIFVKAHDRALTSGSNAVLAAELFKAAVNALRELALLELADVICISKAVVSM